MLTSSKQLKRTYIISTKKLKNIENWWKSRKSLLSLGKIIYPYLIFFSFPYLPSLKMKHSLQSWSVLWVISITDSNPDSTLPDMPNYFTSWWFSLLIYSYSLDYCEGLAGSKLSVNTDIILLMGPQAGAF